MSYAEMPKDELEVFASLKNVRRVFDVGSRDDISYTEIKPNIELHAFEPEPNAFANLKSLIGSRPKTYLNNYGLGDVAGEFPYSYKLQAFGGGAYQRVDCDIVLPVKTLDWYVKENNIKRIDFLKIDTEGYDHKVLMGGGKILPYCRYVQYETWTDTENFIMRDILSPYFSFHYIGRRNMFCVRHGEKMPKFPDQICEGPV